MRNVEGGSRVCSRSRQKGETRGNNKCCGRDSMVGSFVDWRGGQEMPRWSKGFAVVSASGVVLRRVEWSLAG